MALDTWLDRIKKLNQVFILLFFLGCASLTGWVLVSTYLDNQEIKPGEVAVVTKSASKTTSVKTKALSLGNYNRLAGTDTILAPIHLRTTEAGYRYSNGAVRNLLFISRKDDKVALLFPHNEYRIYEYTMVRAENYTDVVTGKVNAILCQLIKDDSDGDGNLSEDDGKSVMMVSTDGKTSKEILASVDSVMSSDTLPNGQISILYQSKGKILNKRIHPVTFETLSDVILFDLEKAAQHG